MGQFIQGYNIDICFVIDATGSMGPIIDQVKANAKQMHEKIIDGMEDANKNVKQLRISVIDFADFASEGDDAIHSTDFFVMPEGADDFKRAVDAIDIGLAKGGKGGDVPENALEALFIAMNQDWTPLSMAQNGRHIIVLITDAPPLPLGARDGSIGYNKDDYPENIAELEEIWKEKEAAQGAMKSTQLHSKKKRLVLFAPAGPEWDAVRNWEYTISNVVDADSGLIEFNVDDIVAEIVRSATD